MDINGTKEIAERNTYSVANEAIKALQTEIPPSEAKILRLIISQIEPSQTGNWEYTCTSAGLAKMIGVSSDFLRHRTNNKRYPTQARLIAGRLEDAKINMLPPDADETDSRNIHLFYSVAARSGRWRFVLHPELYPYVQELKAFYHSYNWHIVKHLETSRGIRLYELLSCYAYLSAEDRTLEDGTEVHAGEIALDADFLRHAFEVEGKYQKTPEFIRWVIAAAERDLANHAGVTVTHRTALAGHRVKWIIFRMSVPDALSVPEHRHTLDDVKNKYGTTSYTELDDIRRMIENIK